MKRFVSFLLVTLGTAAPVSADPIGLVNHGFESGLTGWTSTGNVQARGPTSVLTFNSVEWAVSPSGSAMGALNSDGGAAASLDAFFGLPAGTLQGLNDAGYDGLQGQPSGALTNGSGIYQDFTGNAGDTVTMFFDYVARDYIPFNDPSFAVLVSPSGFQAELISSVWAGGVEAGTAGNSGWRSIMFTLPEDGTHRIGFGVTNERDTILDAALFLDSSPGTITTDDLLPGEEPVFPVLPDGNPLPGVFVFDDPTPGLWYDPPFAASYTYTLLNGGEFIAFSTPDASFGFGDLTFTDNNGLNASFTAMAGTLYNLGTPTSQFTISGLANNLIDFADPSFPTAFPVFLDFTGQTASTVLQIDVTPHQVQAPEPATYALLTFGLGALLARRRRTTR